MPKRVSHILALSALLAAGMAACADDIKFPYTATSSNPQDRFRTGRDQLRDQGITFDFAYTNDVLSNLSGGARRGTIDQGKLEAQMTVDLTKLAGWPGLTLYANVFQTHNTGRIRRDYVGGINPIAAIEATPSTRLSEVWVEQTFLGESASVRIGQLAADSEFFFSSLNEMFLQSDWPTIASVNLPGGGIAYPLATPGIRLKAQPNPHTTALIALFNGDPAGPCAGEPDTCNRYGLNFRLRDPALLIGELQFRAHQAATDTALARTIKIGGWRHLGLFDDQRHATGGGLLADPAGSAGPVKRRGDYGIYAILEQQIYRPRGGTADSGVSVFGRASMSPPDRNLVSLQIDAGIVFAGLVPGRPHDRFGASAIYARFSDAARGFDRDRLTFGVGPGYIRDHEINLELTYVAQAAPGWTIQPNVQYIRHPGGQPGRDARVAGIRSIWKF